MTGHEQDLPNFMIIGAAKAGTSSLFNIIGSHAQVFHSQQKELGFFSNDEFFTKGLDWYARTHFSGAHKFLVRMEASPAYLAWSEKTAPRMQSAFDGRRLKMAVIFRNPIQRAYSHYWHRRRLGHDDAESFEQAIHTEEQRLRDNWDTLSATGNGLYGYFRAGCYASRMKPFLEHFDKRDFIFLLQEDIFPEKFQASMKRVMDFLEIDSSVELALEKANESTKPRSASLTKLYWGLKQTVLKPLYRNWLPASTRKKLYATLFPPEAYPPIGAAIQAELRLRYREEVQGLADIIQRDLSHWLSA